MERPVLRILLITALFAAALALSACQTPSEDSDLPWNMPQQWENAPGIPGLEGR
jgi:hypothetical protein